MKKTESSQLTIGSWVFADGAPRQVCCITTKKVGFKRGNCGQRDFYRFDQISGIPLSEPLLKECVKVNPPKSLTPEYVSVEFMCDIVVIKEGDGTIDYLRFSNLHIMQAYFLSHYGCKVEFDVEKWKGVTKQV